MKENPILMVLNAIGLLVKPIVRLALRNGVTFKQFSELCKRLYVDVAVADYGVAGRETNTSRVALITGINRKDIKQLRERSVGESGEAIFTAPDRISRILSAWHRAPYLSLSGEPLLLPMEGELSFTSLVKKNGGDIAVITLLKEFKRSAVIEELTSGKLKVLKRYFIPNTSVDPQTIPNVMNPKPLLHASSLLDDHVTTIFHNLYRENTELPKRFERRVTNYAVDKSSLPEFQQFIELKGQALLEEIDDWLNAHQLDNTKEGSEAIRLGFGTYWIQNASQQET